VTRAVDLFAGWGGFSLAAKQAGLEVVWAANHWPVAVQVHAANHPTTVHECQDLRQADWTALPRYDVLLAAPACQGHSTASQPKRRLYHDERRATAWAVVDCADVTEPQTLIVENVPAFLRWRLFPQWRDALRALGYHLQEQIVTASHHGVPQRRERLFIIGTRKMTHVRLRKTAEPAFGPCLDPHAGGWRPLAEAADGVRGRVAKARARGLGHTFLTQNVTGHPGVPLDEPIRTITTAPQHWALVAGDQYRYLTGRELARGMGFPEWFTWPEDLSVEDVTQGLGNAVCPGAGADVIEAALNAPAPFAWAA
jgi:DNA (cytosine-5)-methyltransferase 1